MFFFGIEHEVAFLNQAGKFADFSRTKFADFQQIVERLPSYPNDYAQLRVGDAGIKQKRWYIEGFERFADSDKVIDCLPKGIEIRTTIHSNIQGAINELSESFCLLREVAADYGFSPVLTSFNPYQTIFEPKPPLNEYEIKYLQAYPDEHTANIYMVSYGPDLNISVADLSVEKLIDIGKKLTYYSPYIVPFSYSSPFYDGRLWEGLSVRTFIRTGKRSATLVFVEKEEQIIASVPSLIKKARIPAEVGRIEFKAFDSCDDFSLYAALLALLKGLVLDETLLGRAPIPDADLHPLLGRAPIPDADLHQVSAKQGFDNAEIWLAANQVLEAAEIALKDDPDIDLLMPLKIMLNKRETKAQQLIQEYKQLGSIEEVMRQSYLEFI